MALPLAHGAGGYLAYEVLRPVGRHRPGLLALAVGLAWAPDLDFLPGLLTGQPEAWHRGVTHTVAAVAVAGVLAGLIHRARRGRREGLAVRVGLVAMVAWASHLLLDFLTADTTQPAGARFLWPFSDRFHLASRPLLDEIVLDRSGTLAFLAGLFAPGTMTVWAEEAAVLVCVVALVHLVRGMRAGLAAPAGEAAGDP